MRRGHEPVHGISIDPPDAHDRDDALWARPDGDGFLLRVSIANVAAAVPKDGTVDREAFERAHSWYGADTRHMLPPRLVRTASLVEGKKRNVLTLLVRIGANGGFDPPRVSTAKLRPAAALSYHQADALLNDPSHPLYETLSALERVGSLIRGARTAAGVLLPDDEPGSQNPYAQLRSCRIVEECMVFANRLFAGMLASAGVPALFRATTETEQGTRAVYGPTPRLHAQLAVQAYAHCTSPIRRYADVVNQRQLLALVGRQQLPYSPAEIASIAARLNEQAGVDAEDWELQPLPGMSDRGFSRFVVRACRNGIGAVVLEEARGRFLAGTLNQNAQAAILGEATLAGSSARDLRNRILRTVAQRPHAAMQLLMLVCQYVGLPPATVAMTFVGDGNVLGTVTVCTTDGDISASSAHTIARQARTGAGIKMLRQLSH